MHIDLKVSLAGGVQLAIFGCAQFSHVIQIWCIYLFSLTYSPNTMFTYELCQHTFPRSQPQIWSNSIFVTTMTTTRYAVILFKRQHYKSKQQKMAVETSQMLAQEFWRWPTIVETKRLSYKKETIHCSLHKKQQLILQKHFLSSESTSSSWNASLPSLQCLTSSSGLSSHIKLIV